MHDLKPYPEYRETGLPWLTQVPAHWSMSPNRAVMRRRKVLVGDQHSQYRLLSLTKEGVIVRDVASGKGKFSTDLGTSQEVRSGDLVLCLFDVPETPRTIGLSRYDGMITGAYTVMDFLIPDHARYLELFYTAMDDRKLLSPLYSGLRNTIPPARFLGTKSPLPPADEQASIVRFLDHINRRIERTIRGKRKVIALLNEQKQVIIHRAVTHGKHSEWKSWPVRAVLRPTKRFGYPDKTLLSLFRDFGVIPKDSRHNKNADVQDLSLCQLVKPGDVVMNKMKAWQGSIAVSELEGIVSPDYMVLEFIIDDVVDRYFHYLLRSPEMVTEYRKNAYGVRPGQWRLMYPEFCRLHLSIPPVREQERIVSQIEDETHNIERTIAHTETEVNLLREYRTRLASDVVTGKLDVREAAAGLPAEIIEEPEADTEPEELEDDNPDA